MTARPPAGFDERMEMCRNVAAEALLAISNGNPGHAEQILVHAHHRGVLAHELCSEVAVQAVKQHEAKAKAKVS